MDATFVTDAIVLKRDPFREADSRVVLYSRDHGLLELIARGAKKPSSKLSGHLEPFTAVSIMVVPGRRHSYVGAAVDQRAHRVLKARYETVHAAGECARSFLTEVRGGIADVSLYHLWGGFLEMLDRPGLDAARIELAAAGFRLRLLSALGYRPVLTRCLECDQAMKDEEGFFDPARGGILCGAHGKGKGLLTISEKVGNIMKSLLLGKNVFSENIDPETAVRTGEIIRSFYHYHSLNQR